MNLACSQCFRITDTMDCEEGNERERTT